MKRALMVILSILVVAAMSFAMPVHAEGIRRTCYAQGCYEKVTGNGNYCDQHTCVKSGCTSRMAINQQMYRELFNLRQRYKVQGKSRTGRAPLREVMTVLRLPF